MNFVKLLLLGGALALGYHGWHEHKRTELLKSATTQSVGEFIPTAMPDGAAKDTVLVLAPVNCPSNAAKRADALAAQLEHMGLKTVRANSFSLHVPNPSAEDKANMERAASILQGDIPAVFINGMGKSNPTAEQVAQVFRQTQNGKGD